MPRDFRELIGRDVKTGFTYNQLYSIELKILYTVELVNALERSE